MRPLPAIMRAMILPSALSLALLALLAMPSGLTAQETAIMRLETRIALGNVAGRIDHLAFDAASGRLFIAELGNNSVSVVDLEKRAVVHRITGLSEPQGIAFIDQMLYVANGGDGVVRWYGGNDFTSRGQIALGSDADNIRFDAADKQLVVGYGSGALAVLDPATHKVVATYPLKAHPESFQIDAARDRIFVNLPDAHAVAVLERSTGKQLAQWPLNYGANFPMTLDPSQPRVFTVFRKPARLVAYAMGDGKTLADVTVCGDADDVFFDARRKRVYAICGEGFIEVFDAGDTLKRVGRVPTSEGARTGLFMSDLDRLVVAARAHGKEPATLWVFAPNH
jgi:YVTN family beta-propeller protein